MEQVNQLTQGEKVATINRTETGEYLVEYVHGELTVNAGFFTSQEVAEAKAQELFDSETISGELLVGDVPPIE